jgi:hypothetical protein
MVRSGRQTSEGTAGQQVRAELFPESTKAHCALEELNIFISEFTFSGRGSSATSRVFP